MVDNPLVPGGDVEQILSLYTPEELANYRKRGMLDSRGIPTIPPGGKFNSSGMPISDSMNSMSPQERQSASVMDNLARAGKLWGPTTNPIAPSNPTSPTNPNLMSPSYM